MTPEVTILLVNWNGRQWLERFLPALTATDYPALRFLMVDNASSDDSVAYVRAQFPQIEILQSGENLGFAAGNNFALPHITTPYIALVNTDVEVTPGWLAPLVALLEARPELAAVQPKILAERRRTHFEYAGAAGGWLDAWGYPFCRGRVFDELEADAGQYDTTADVFWVSGACMVIRKAVIDRIGLFDPTYFAHWEEIDFCWRAQNAGWRLACCPQGVVYHVGGGTLSPDHPNKVFYNFRNSLLTLLKNLPLDEALLIIYVRLVLDGVAALKGLLTEGNFAYLLAIARAHSGFYRLAPQALAERRKQTQKPLRSLTGVWSGSVVRAYFLGKKKRFIDLLRA